MLQIFLCSRLNWAATFKWKSIASPTDQESWLQDNFLLSERLINLPNIRWKIFTLQSDLRQTSCLRQQKWTWRRWRRSWALRLTKSCSSFIKEVANLLRRGFKKSDHCYLHFYLTTEFGWSSCPWPTFPDCKPMPQLFNFQYPVQLRRYEIDTKNRDTNNNRFAKQLLYWNEKHQADQDSWTT